MCARAPPTLGSAGRGGGAAALTAVAGLADSELVAYRLTRTGDGDLGLGTGGDVGLGTGADFGPGTGGDFGLGTSGGAAEWAPLLTCSGPENRLASTLVPGATAALTGVALSGGGGGPRRGVGRRLGSRVGSGGGALLCSPPSAGGGAAEGALAVPRPLPHGTGGESGGSSTIGVATGVMGFGTAVMGIIAGPAIIPIG